jgi:HSP20 family protein
VKWKPANLERTFAGDPFFDRFFNLFEDGAWERPQGNWAPAMDVVEDNDRLIVRLDLPGIDPKTVDVKLTGDRLTVSGERKFEEKENATYLKREQVYGMFSRAVRLPYQIAADKVHATWSNGVMEIELPKAEQFVSREIPIQVK